jgi:hypothetical protein
MNACVILENVIAQVLQNRIVNIKENVAIIRKKVSIDLLLT